MKILCQIIILAKSLFPPCKVREISVKINYMKKEKLLIIDSNALLHRAWHAIPPLTTKTGQLVNAVYGFYSILFKALKDVKPKYVVATFDKKAPTFRHKEFKEYKAKRVKQPDELYEQIPLIKEILEILEIPIFEQDGFEADDLIGTICREKSVDNDKIESIILTGDKDALQLVDANTKVLILKKGVSETALFDEKMVEENYGFQPNQTIDFKALRGDPSDNIPGVKGIGEKTATKLIQDFNNLEKIYKDIDSEKIKESVRKKLIDHKDDAFLSKKLATIITNVRIEFSLEDCCLQKFDRQNLFLVLQKFGFKSLLNRVMILEKIYGTTEQNLFSMVNTNSVQDEKIKKVNYQLINNDKKFKDFFDKLKKQSEFVFDTETDGLNPLINKLLGISFCWKEKNAYYIITELCEKNRKDLTKIFANKNIKKIGHNIKFDVKVLKNFGINVFGISFDTMIAAYLLSHGTRAYSLDSLAFSEFGYQMQSITELIGKKGKNQLNLGQVEIEKVSWYSCEDADFTWRLYEKLSIEIHKERLDDLFFNIEIPLIPVLIDIEMNGVKINEKFLNKMSNDVKRNIQKLTEKIYKFAGRKFNINSPMQLKEILFQELKIFTQGISRTKTGFSTAASELEKMRKLHPIIKLILEYRELAKLDSTYLSALPKLINLNTNRVHANFNQAITATGRLSSSNPNLQNIPIRTELGGEVRKAFIAEKGFKILSADYSQVELRIVASLANDEEMIEAFKNNEDIHTRTASEIYDVKLSEVTKEMRRFGKTINFGIIYGMGVYGLARRAEMSQEQASEFLEKYFDLHYRIKDYLDETLESARENEYVETLFHRRRYLRDINSGVAQIRNSASRMAINMPVQGTAADLVKIAMIKVKKVLDKKFNPDDVKIILQVHDELVFEVKEKLVDEVQKMVKIEMENACDLKVPIKVDFSVGDNWGK